MNIIKIFSKHIWEQIEQYQTRIMDLQNQVNRLSADIERLKSDRTDLLDMLRSHYETIKSLKRQINAMYENGVEKPKGWEERFPFVSKVDEDNYISKKEAMAVLGIRATYLNELKRRGHFDGCRLNKYIYYSRESIGKFMWEHIQNENGTYKKK